MTDFLPVGTVELSGELSLSYHAVDGYVPTQTNYITTGSGSIDWIWTRIPCREWSGGQYMSTAYALALLAFAAIEENPDSTSDDIAAAQTALFAAQDAAELLVDQKFSLCGTCCGTIACPKGETFTLNTGAQKTASPSYSTGTASCSGGNPDDVNNCSGYPKTLKGLMNVLFFFQIGFDSVSHANGGPQTGPLECLWQFTAVLGDYPLPQPADWKNEVDGPYYPPPTVGVGANFYSPWIPITQLIGSHEMTYSVDSAPPGTNILQNLTRGTLTLTLS